VRKGVDEKLKRRPPTDKESGHPGHILSLVYQEMMLQICLDYSSIPDVRTLSMSEIRFFYNGIRSKLQSETKPRDKKGS